MARTLRGIRRRRWARLTKRATPAGDLGEVLRAQEDTVADTRE